MLEEMVSLTIYSVGIFSHLDNDCLNFKTFVFLVKSIGPSEHHHTTQTSKFNKKLNGVSTMSLTPSIDSLKTFATF